jgi:hypothetical protein
MMELLVKSISALIGFVTGIVAGTMFSNPIYQALKGDVLLDPFAIWISVGCAIGAGVAGAVLGADFGEYLIRNNGVATKPPPPLPPANRPPRPPITLD